MDRYFFYTINALEGGGGKISGGANCFLVVFTAATVFQKRDKSLINLIYIKGN